MLFGSAVSADFGSTVGDRWLINWLELAKQELEVTWLLASQSEKLAEQLFNSEVEVELAGLAVSAEAVKRGK